MSLERGSGLGQVLLGSSRGSNECFCISPRDPIRSALSDGPAYPGTNGSVRPAYPGTPRIHVAQWRGTKLFSAPYSRPVAVADLPLAPLPLPGRDQQPHLRGTGEPSHQLAVVEQPTRLKDPKSEREKNFETHYRSV